MAERRMYSKTILMSDEFLDMPQSARLLYYDLALRADDDGFVNSPKRIMREIGSSQDDLSILIVRGFILPFASGVIVITHWQVHNYIRKDTYNKTRYTKEFEMLELDENKTYRYKKGVPSTARGRLVDDSYTQDRLGKDRLGKDCQGKDFVGDRPDPINGSVPPYEELYSNTDNSDGFVGIDIND